MSKTEHINTIGNKSLNNKPKSKPKTKSKTLGAKPLATTLLIMFYLYELFNYKAEKPNEFRRDGGKVKQMLKRHGVNKVLAFAQLYMNYRWHPKKTVYGFEMTLRKRLCYETLSIGTLTKANEAEAKLFPVDQEGKDRIASLVQNFLGKQEDNNGNGE